MATSHNVLLKRQYAAYNLDVLNRTAVATVDMDNGCIMTLSGKSTTPGEGEVWTAAQATATSTGVWMASAPELVTVEPAPGLAIRGITPDPRAFTNIANKPFDVFKPMIGDIIEMTGEGITDVATNDYLVPGTANFALVSATAAGTGFAMKKIGTSKLHIGDASLVKVPVPTYIYEVVNN